MRVEQLAGAAGVSVDTVRYYQARGLLPAPRREGRVAWYGPDHLSRLTRIRDLAGRGLTLATIGRLLRGELDSADEALAAAVSEAEVAAPSVTLSEPDGTGGLFGIEELARRTGIPLALLQAVSREGLLVARTHDGEERFTEADVEAAAAGLVLLEAGLPLPEVMDLARRHHGAMREVAERAVTLFDEHVRKPLRGAGAERPEARAPEAGARAGADAAERLVAAFQTLLPATMTIVSHHFQRTLLAVALEHIERVGDGPELAAVRHESLRLEQGA
jgi:DNA-binding transcriptional MerR regulator